MRMRAGRTGWIGRWLGQGRVGKREGENLDVPYFIEGRDPPAPVAEPGREPWQCEDPILALRVEPLLQSRILPLLATHGGSCQLVDVKADGTVLLRLTGACHGCSMSAVTLKAGIERILKEALPEVAAVEAVAGAAPVGAASETQFLPVEEVMR